MSEIQNMGAYTFAKKPTGIPVPGNKVIDEYIGRLNSNTDNVSVAKMIAPPGWGEPRQIPEFDEITIVISGRMQVETDNEVIELKVNQPFLAHKNHSIRYSNPYDEPAEYWAICIPAFSNETVNRDKDEL
jgi:mannose-6-phosphate isomerase-like protein (cupin superfamily)